MAHSSKAARAALAALTFSFATAHAAASFVDDRGSIWTLTYSGVAVTMDNGPGVDLAWVFDITLNNGALFTAADQAAVKARYIETAGPHLVGGNTTLVPEPGSYALLLAGLALLGFSAHRKALKGAL